MTHHNYIIDNTLGYHYTDETEVRWELERIPKNPRRLNRPVQNEGNREHLDIASLPRPSFEGSDNVLLVTSRAT